LPGENTLAYLASLSAMKEKSFITLTPEGPQRILEEDSHLDRVDSIQWCNTPALRFLSGSKDGTARIWSYSNHKWTSVVLNMSTGDNREKKPAQPPPGPASNLPSGPSNGDANRNSQRRQPAASNNGQNVRPVRAAAVAAASTLAQVVNHDENADEPGRAAAAEKSEKQVTMVAW